MIVSSGTFVHCNIFSCLSVWEQLFFLSIFSSVCKNRPICPGNLFYVCQYGYLCSSPSFPVNITPVSTICTCSNEVLREVPTCTVKDSAGRGTVPIFAVARSREGFQSVPPEPIVLDNLKSTRF